MDFMRLDLNIGNSFVILNHCIMVARFIRDAFNTLISLPTLNLNRWNLKWINHKHQQSTTMVIPKSMSTIEPINKSIN